MGLLNWKTEDNMKRIERELSLALASNEFQMGLRLLS